MLYSLLANGGVSETGAIHTMEDAVESIVVLVAANAGVSETGAIVGAIDKLILAGIVVVQCWCIRNRRQCHGRCSRAIHYRRFVFH